jgi:hypothetical protein
MYAATNVEFIYNYLRACIAVALLFLCFGGKKSEKPVLCLAALSACPLLLMFKLIRTDCCLAWFFPCLSPSPLLPLLSLVLQMDPAQAMLVLN